MTDHSLPRLYGEFAELWPLLSPPEDYASEAKSLRKILEDHLGESSKDSPQRIVEFGAGGGHTLCHFAEDYEVTAVDLSRAMLDCCKRLVPEAEVVEGDMQEVILKGEYDAILCHDAIDYILTAGDLKKVFANAKRHLKAGGLFVVAPTYTRETFLNGDYAADQNADENLELTYMTYVHDPDPGDDTFEMILVYVIRKAGQVSIEEDRHTCSIFAEGQWLKWLNGAGFETELYATEAEETEGEEQAPCRLFVAVKK